MTYCNWSASVVLCRALTIEHFYLLLDNYHTKSFQIWCEAFLEGGGGINRTFHDSYTSRALGPG